MQEQQEETAENTIIPQSKKLKNEKPLKQFKINIQLITETSLDQSIAQSLSQQQKIEAVIQLKSIHLQWLNIRRIQNLEVFTNLNILYLQHNNIEKIEHLQCLINLEYLALNDNVIQKVQGLKTLTKLSGLNLNNNQIQQLDVKQLPLSIQLLSFRGNPVCLDANYKNDIVKYLPILQILDQNTITPEDKLKIVGKFPNHLIQYSQKMKNFRLKQKIKKQLEQDEKKQFYQGDGVNQTQTIKQMKDKTKKYMDQAKKSHKQVVKQQMQNYEQKIKISRKIRNFKQKQNEKSNKMGQIAQSNEQHTQQN